MQQTEHLKLNLIETGDPISPAPINENAETLEAALATKTDETRTDGLEQRVTALEAHYFYVGSYTGNGQSDHFINLGFTPLAILASGVNGGTMTHLVTRKAELKYGSSTVIKIVENGFTVSPVHTSSANTSGTLYNYIAFT